MSEEITYRTCETLEEFDRCVELQRIAWRFNDLELVPKEIFIVAAKTGGQIFGAFDGGRQCGFALSVPAIRDRKTYLHSHMLAVEPEYANRGIGRRLKLLQWDEALSRGIDLIEWTFDPLVLKNAHLNVNRLGVVIRRYIRDLYGRTSSPLHAATPTDRLVAEWRLTSPRVERALADAPSPSQQSPPVRTIAIPIEIEQWRRDDPERAVAFHSRMRDDFEKAFDSGLAVTGFRLGDAEGTYELREDAD